MTADSAAPHPVLQHYVPRFLLRRFASGTGRRRSRHRLWVYDKWSRRSFPRTVQNAAAENGFYDLDFNNLRVTLEGSLANLEGRAAPCFATVVNEGALSSLSDEDRRVIALFVAVQLLRTPQHRFVQERLREDFVELYEQCGVPREPDPEKFDPAEAARKLSMDTVIRDAPGFARILLTKQWVLFQAPRTAPFWISDHPVVLANSSGDRGPFGSNLGLGDWVAQVSKSTCRSPRRSPSGFSAPRWSTGSGTFTSRRSALRGW